MPVSPHLYIIPTPIGNLGDITLRALEVLGQLSWLLCEDTRRTRKLLTYHKIKAPRLERFDAYTEDRGQPRLLARLRAGEQAGLLCDAGTPGISDAAYSLVQAMCKANLRVSCLPGATALIPALVCSGLPSTPFYFEGFLPRKKGRRTRLELLQKQESTCVLYESPHRLLKTLRDMQEFLGESSPISISRELSKWHEETLSGSIGELIAHFEAHTPKGEFVLVCRPKAA